MPLSVRVLLTMVLSTAFGCGAGSLDELSPGAGRHAAALSGTDVCASTPGATFNYFIPDDLLSNDGAWLVPTNWNGNTTLQSHLGSGSASMQLAQWGTADALQPSVTPPASCAYAGYTAAWGSSNTFQRACGLQSATGGWIVDLAQDNDDQSFPPPSSTCGGGLSPTCCREVDLYAEPVRVSGNPPGFIADGPALSELSKLQANVALQLSYFRQGTLCGPVKLGGPEYSALSVDYWLADATDGESFVYEVALWDSREEVNPTGAQDNPCVAQGYKPMSPGRVVSDAIANYGQACIKTGDTSWHTYDLNVLPRMVNWITTNTVGYSQDPSRWKISGAYLGSTNQGSNTVDSRYAAWTLAGTCAN